MRSTSSAFVITTSTTHHATRTTQHATRNTTPPMAKNRKNQSGAVRFIPALKAIFLCMLIGGSAVGYVLQKNKLYDLGRQITRRELLLERLKWENNLRA